MRDVFNENKGKIANVLVTGERFEGKVVEVCEDYIVLDAAVGRLLVQSVKVNRCYITYPHIASVWFIEESEF